MTSFDLTVDTRDLRAALVSVMPHASQDPEHVVSAGLVLAATDRFTGALAKVDVDDRERYELGCFDMTLQDAKEILALFKPVKEVPHSVHLEHDGKQFRVTDVSGLFPGKSVRFEAFATATQYPDVANIIGKSVQAVRRDVRDEFGVQVFGTGELAEALRRPPTWRSGYNVTGSAMAKFSAAGRAFGSLSIEPTVALPPALVITAGPNFAGLLIPERRGDDEEEWHAEVRAGWIDLTADVSASHPIEPEVRKARDSQPVVELSDLFDNDDEKDDDES